MITTESKFPYELSGMIYDNPRRGIFSKVFDVVVVCITRHSGDGSDEV